MKIRKALLVCIAVSALLLSACGDAPAASTPAASAAASGAAEPNYYFKDNVLVATFSNITITKWDVIPVGEPGNEKGTAPVIAFWYYATRTSDKISTTPYSAWSNYFSAKQTNTLKAADIPDEAYKETQSESMKVGETVSCAFAYYLENETEPVTLQASYGADDKAIGEQSFDVAAKTAETSVSVGQDSEASAPFGQDKVDNIRYFLKENNYPDLIEISNIKKDGQIVRTFLVAGMDTGIVIAFSEDGKPRTILASTNKFSDNTEQSIYYMLRIAAGSEFVPEEIYNAANDIMGTRAISESQTAYDDSGYYFIEKYEKDSDKMSYYISMPE